MKRVLFFLVAILLVIGAEAQIIKRIADRTKNKLENKASEKINEGIDKATDKPKKKSGDEKDSKNKNGKEAEDETSDADKDSEQDSDNTKATENKPASLSSYSKFDFIPGEKVVVFANFEKDAIGDFPVNWNTNASGEVVTLNNVEGKWFKIDKEGTFHPEAFTEIPDNFTLEFDIGVNNEYEYNSSDLGLTLGYLGPDDKFTDMGMYPHFNTYEGIRMTFHPAHNENGYGYATFYNAFRGNHRIDNKVDVEDWNPVKGQNFIHFALWRQNERLRLYANQHKIFDLPKAFDKTAKFNALLFSSTGMNSKKDYMVINNIRLAVGKPDTRNKLITEGKFVTRGILFDVNSDHIKPESFGVLKDIAGVLNENPTVKITIVGHTDADGDDAANLDLSKRRAAAVKQALEKEFNVSGDRIQTDGKGESQPVDKNDTSEGKANNRRVEFIKN